MPSSPRRAVITGLGVISPVGLDSSSFWQSLRNRRSGIRRIQAYDFSAMPSQFGGEVVDFDPKNFLDKKKHKRLKMMARTIQFAVASAQVALDDARLDKDMLDPRRFGVVFGAGTIPGELAELGPAAVASMNPQRDAIDLQKWGRDGLPLIPPMWLLNHVPNMVSCHVSILHNAQGPTNTLTQTDIAGLLALGEARRWLQRDRADVFLVGGADTKVNPVSWVRQSLFAEVSRRNDAPQRACRPFDRWRDGLVLGEGGGAFVLEEREHALRRGAPIWAEVVGFGAAFDRDQSGRGIARAVRAALDEAELQPDQLDHINAHGISTVEGDAWEARGLREAFGKQLDVLPVFAPKSYFGLLGAGAGPVELAASLLALKHGQLPATLNYDEPDPRCPLRVLRTPGTVRRPCFLKLGLTDMGQCAAVICYQATSRESETSR